MCEKLSFSSHLCEFNELNHYICQKTGYWKTTIKSKVKVKDDSKTRAVVKWNTILFRVSTYSIWLIRWRVRHVTGRGKTSKYENKSAMQSIRVKCCPSTDCTFSTHSTYRSPRLSALYWRERLAPLIVHLSHPAHLHLLFSIPNTFVYRFLPSNWSTVPI